MWQPHISNQLQSGRSQTYRSMERQKVLVILTQTRSGSSFTGEVFAAATKSIYFYEPLYPFGHSCKPYSNEKQAVLKQLLQCKFTGLNHLYNDGFNKSNYTDGAKCKDHGLCFTGASPGLVNRYHEFCTGKRGTFQPKSKECGYPLKGDILENMCNKSQLLITKIVRLCSVRELEDVYEFLTASGKNVFVLHLVRDLR